MSKTVAQIAELAHGYTMAEVDSLARTALNRSKQAWQLDYTDRFEASWFGVVEHLYSAAETPSPRDLIAAGMAAISTEVNKQMSARGVEAHGGFTVAPNFSKYWSHIGARQDFTEKLIERLALPAVLGQLTDLQYEAVSTLAALGSQQLAADALGISIYTYRSRLNDARAVAIAAWFDDETPVKRKRGNAESCSYGHDRATHGVHNGRQWRCRVCDRNTVRRARARGERKPVPVV